MTRRRPPDWARRSRSTVESLDDRPGGYRATCRRRAICRRSEVQLADLARTASPSTSRPPRPASTPSGPSSRRPATRSARTTEPTRTPSSRASRGSWSLAGDTRSSELVAALEAQRQEVDTVVPERSDGPRRASLRTTARPRRRAPGSGSADRQLDGAPGLRPGSRQGSRHGRRPGRATAREATPRRRSRRRCRSTWACATGRSSRTSRSSSSSTSRAPWRPATATAFNRGIGGGTPIQRRPQGRHRQGGDPACRCCPDRSRRIGVVAFNESAHWVIQTAAARRRRRCGGQLGGIRPEGQTNIFAGPVRGG